MDVDDASMHLHAHAYCRHDRKFTDDQMWHSVSSDENTATMKACVLGRNPALVIAYEFDTYKTAACIARSAFSWGKPPCELCHGLKFRIEFEPVSARECVVEGFRDRFYSLYK